MLKRSRKKFIQKFISWVDVCVCERFFGLVFINLFFNHGFRRWEKNIDKSTHKSKISENLPTNSRHKSTFVSSFFLVVVAIFCSLHTSSLDSVSPLHLSIFRVCVRARRKVSIFRIVCFYIHGSTLWSEILWLPSRFNREWVNKPKQ